MEDVALPTHYLQTVAWSRLRSEFRKERAIETTLSSKTYPKFIGHIALERRTRSVLRERVLEYAFGPSREILDHGEDFSLEVFEQIVKIARNHRVQKIRIHSYTHVNFGYVTLKEYTDILTKGGISFTTHPSMTLMYELDKHEYNSLSNCDASVRKNLRKANDVRIIVANTPEIVHDFLISHAQIKVRKAPQSHEITAYQNWQEGCVLLLAYDSTGIRCLGTLGFVHDDFLATEIASSTSKGPEARGVQEKLHLASFDEAKKLGIKKFDLAGLENNAEGLWNSIAKFKIKFGGEFIESGFIEIDMRMLRNIL
jgi:hypothetical protein